MLMNCSKINYVIIEHKHICELTQIELEQPAFQKA